MPKLETKDKTVAQLFEPNKTRFLIPDYQRPYEWGEKECATLWTDLFDFAFPDGDPDKFDRDNDEYFLGPIVTFLNDEEKQEVIDGQQRLTTLLLLLRAFYAKYEEKQDKGSIKAREQIAPCIWKTDEIDETPDTDSCKLETEVATDESRDDFMEILKNGAVSKEKKSRYASNYRFFQTQIDEFLKIFDGYLPHFSTRILKNCLLLEITANSSDSAMRIFSTLNDRGKPLSDSDIFKAQLYKHYTKGKEDFIKKWKQFEEVCTEVYHPIRGIPLDEAFSRYMYYERAKLGIKHSTTEALRKFYEKDSYALLKKDETFENIIDLANFWQNVSRQNPEKFSERVLKRLFVLNYAPNDMWTNIVSVYYLQKRDNDGMLDDEKFYQFLNKITAFIWAFSFSGDRNDLRTPMYDEMVNIVGDKEVGFDRYKFEIIQLTNTINNYVFSNNSAMTRPMLTWWAFNDEAQTLPELGTAFQIEHIYAKKLHEFENSLSNTRNLEALGNKILLEKRINIRAADYRFADKVRYYNGYTNARKEWKDGTQINELQKLAATLNDFTENEIVQRNALIIQKFIEYLKKNDLIK